MSSLLSPETISTPKEEEQSDREWDPNTNQSSQDNPGFNHWIERRKSWTKGHRKYTNQKVVSNHAAIRHITTLHYDGIYEAMVDRKKFSTPVPLSFVMDVLIHGWKKEGLWNLPRKN